MIDEATWRPVTGGVVTGRREEESAMRRDRTWSRVVGQNVRHHRHHLNLTQGEVARRLEQQGYRYSAVQISRLETWTPYVDGNVPIVSVDLLVCLAIALEVDAHDLLILDQKER